MAKLKPEIKEPFLAKLRSGEYKQITGQLRREGNCRCVLGVLGEVLVEKGLAEWVSQEKVYPSWALRIEGDTETDLEASIHPRLVQKMFAGLEEGQNPDKALEIKTTGGRRANLWLANDRGTHNFLELADIIEEQL